VFLPDQVIERLRPIFSREDLVAHNKTLAFPETRERRKIRRFKRDGAEIAKG
jgi:hypothetical protein